MAASAIASIGLLVLGLGVVALARPRALMAWVQRLWQSRAGLRLTVGIRAAVGVLFLAGARSTRFPWAIGALGVLSLVSAASLPLLGSEQIREFVDSLAARSASFLRAWALVFCVFGGFLVYAAL